MAKRSETLELIIRVKELASKEVKKLNTFLSKTSGKLKQAAKEAISLKGAVIGLGSVYAAFKIGKELTTAAAEQARAVAGLETAMKSMGRYTPELSTQMQTLAISLQGVTNFGDEATIQGQKFLVTYRNISDDLLPRSTIAMQDLAALMGGDVVQAANMLGKASMGMTGELRRVGISVSSGTYKLKGYKGVLAEIESQVKGQAKAMRDASGPWIAIGNVIGDVKEKLGDFINIAFEQFGKDMIAYVKQIGEKLERLKKDADFKEWARATGKAMGDFIIWMIKGMAYIVEFGVKYKTMLLIIVGTGAAVIIVGKLVTVINTLSAALVVMTGPTVAAWLVGIRAALVAVTIQAGLLATAFKLTLAGAAAYSVIQIGSLIKACWDLHKAEKMLEDTKEQESVVSAHAAENVRKLSEEIGITIESMDEFNRMVAEGAIVYDEASGKWIQAQQKGQEAVKASTTAIEAFEKAAQKAYDAAIKKAAEYAQKVIAWEEKIKYARLSTEDKIRALQRKGMTDEYAWYDKKRQAEEKLSAAKEALANKDYALAEKLAKDAESLYANLATEVKKEVGDESVVVKAIGQTVKIATAGITEVGKFTEKLYSEQKNAAREMEDQYRESAELIKIELDDIAGDREAKIEITLDGLEAAKNKVENWINDPATKIVYIKTVEQKATGGRVLGMARGGRFPGDSKQDSLWVRARPGEGFVRNEALSVWDSLLGPGFFEGINAPWSKAGQRIKAAMSGNISGFSIPVPGAPRMADASGGRVPDMGLKDMGPVEINLGNKAYPVMGRIDVIEELKGALIKEKLLRNN